MRFSDILGHTKEINILKGAIAGGRLAHAYLFAGPDGIGKRQAAYALATTLNCNEAQADACGQCLDCGRAERETHPNILPVWPTVKKKGKEKDAEDESAKDILEKAERPEDGLIRIQQIREVQAALRLKIDAGRKVVVVDAADRMMPAAANAFLKTLEEPPPASIIILITSHPGLLPVTVLSRCQRVNFKPLQDETVVAYLTGKRGVAPTEAAQAAQLAGGSIARGSALACDGAAQRRSTVIGRISAIAPNDVFEAMRFAEELNRMDDGPGEALGFIKGWIRDRAVEEEYQTTSDRAVFMRLWEAYRAVDEALHDITPPRYANGLITMEAMMLKIAGLY